MNNTILKKFKSELTIIDFYEAAHLDPELLAEMITMEEYSGFTFKQNWSLKNLQCRQ